MGFFDDVNDAMSRDTGLRTVANVGLQAMGDTSWRKPESTVDPADAQVYAAQGKAQQQQGIQTAQDLGDRMQRKYFTGLEGPRQQLPSFDPGAGGRDPRQQAWLDKTGNSNYQSGGVQGKQTYNYYDPDKPASMNNPANNPWADMARQLSNFSALRSFDQKMHPEWYPGQNSEAMQLERVRGENHLAGIGLQGQNQLENTRVGHSMQGKNQLENTRLGYSMQGENQGLHDQRTADNTRELTQFKQKLDANDPLKAAQAKESQSRARLLGTQADSAEQAAAYDKTEMGHLQKYRDSLLKSGMINSLEDLKRAEAEEAARLRATKRLGTGYADGGQVETPEQLMARIQAKYGVSGNAPQQQAPAPAPQPARQQAQPQPTGGLMDRLRSTATGGLDRRMQAAGFAEGGSIDVGGRSVYGEGDGKSDSLPAVIDGKHPAALSSGEFVMPIEAVRHFGLDRLNKMVAAARKGLDTGRESA